jgi:protein required for attachment to host cells
MNATWIVSANASRARFFSQASAAAPLEEINDMVNDGARLRMAESSESDRLGPTAGTKSMHNTGGGAPNKLYEPRQTPDEHAAELFARDIVAYLEESQQAGRFQELCLVVSPQFLGMLRKLLPQQLTGLVKLELNKDYTMSGAGELRGHLQAAQALK